jgi:ribA/ribD-fused uncharacterized protein
MKIEEDLFNLIFNVGYIANSFEKPIDISPGISIDWEMEMMQVHKEKMIDFLKKEHNLEIVENIEIIEIKGFFGEYRFLSNFYLSLVWFEGILYPTVEHAYQAAKTKDIIKRTEMSEILSGGNAKRFGKTFPLREDWEDVKLDIMKQLVFHKFINNKDLKAKLLATGNSYLEETNNWKDFYWGVCNGEGSNHLGNILMSVRVFLR